MALTFVAAWGGPDTPFQLAGQPPIKCKPTPDRLREYAGDHLGFYTYLRIANARIVRRVGIGLLELADRCWRNAYNDHQVYPCEAADDALAEGAAEIGCKL